MISHGSNLPPPQAQELFQFASKALSTDEGMRHYENIRPFWPTHRPASRLFPSKGTPD